MSLRNNVSLVYFIHILIQEIIMSMMSFVKGSFSHYEIFVLNELNDLTTR